MIIKTNTREGFILENEIYRVECDFNQMVAAIFKNGEFEHYCKLIFAPISEDDGFNHLFVIATGDNILFDVRFEGYNIDEWTKQLMRVFGDYLKDDIVCGNYNINGFIIEKVL